MVVRVWLEEKVGAVHGARIYFLFQKYIKIESTQKNPYAHANSPEADGRAAHVPASKHQQSAGCWPKCARVWHTTLPFAILPFSVKKIKEKKRGD